MSAARTERLLNLVIALLAAPRPRSVSWIRDNVAGYEQNSDDAFHRMFERDKKELRELGVPVETEPIAGTDEELGYRIRRDHYQLPDISLEPDEAAAVAVAMRLWGAADLSAAMTGAVRKLEAGGIDLPEPADDLEARLGSGEAALAPVLTALVEARALTFDYRAAGAEQATARHVEPWGVLSRKGRWFLVGFDRDRDDERTFRLDRMTSMPTAIGPAGAVSRPADLDLRARLTLEAPDTPVTATIDASRGRALNLRRRADSVQPGDGTDRLTVTFPDMNRLVEEVAAYGTDVQIIDPPQAIRELLAHLEGVSP